MVEDAVFYTPHAVLAYISEHNGRISMSQINALGVPGPELIVMVEQGYLKASKELRSVDLADGRTLIERVYDLTEKARAELSNPESKLRMQLISIVPPSEKDLDFLMKHFKRRT